MRRIDNHVGLTGLGILASNSELIIMRTAGISTRRITMVTIKPALTFIIIGLLMGELMPPDFERTTRVSHEKAMEDDINPRLIATTIPILICLVSGYVLLKRAN
jgi:lipopolysaccharide export LptBFGC system permease protein LptF